VAVIVRPAGRGEAIGPLYGDKGFSMERFQEIEIEWEDYEKLLM
jgi:hypothetical protein